MSGPLARETWQALTRMAATGDGSTPDPEMDAIVELGHRAEQRDELLEAAKETLVFLRELHAVDGALARAVRKAEGRP